MAGQSKSEVGKDIKEMISQPPGPYHAHRAAGRTGTPTIGFKSTLRQSAIARLRAQALAGATVDHLMDEAAIQVSSLLDVDLVEFYEVDSTGRRLLVKAGQGLLPGVRGHATVPVGNASHAGSVFASGASVMPWLIDTDPEFRPGPLLASHGAVSGAGVVIRTGAPSGVLAVHTRSAHEFPEDDRTFLQSIANLIGDAHGRRLAADASRQSERRYQMLFDGSPVAKVMTRPDGAALQVNSSMAALLGITTAAIMGMDFGPHVHDESRATWLAAHEALLAGRLAVWHGELRLATATGETWVLVTSHGVRDDRNEITCLLNIMIDVTEQRRAQASEIASAATMTAVLAAAPLILFTTDLDGNFEFVWGDRLSSLGTPVDQLLGRSLFEVGFEPTLVAALERALAGESIAVDFAGAGGRHFHLVASPIGDLTGRAGISGVSYEDTAQWQVDAGREESAAKTRFLANISHELRNPLNAVMGFSELLGNGSQGTLNEKQERYLGHIKRSADHLLDLINDLLEVARADSDGVSLSLEPVAIVPELDYVAAAIDGRAAARGVRVRVECLPTLVAWADAGRVRQILLNLVGNALKFTLAGSITISARQVGEVVEVTVADTGIGIPPAKLETVFEEFQQLPEGKAYNPDGTGLGLAVCRRLVGRMNGTITAAANSCGGSVFSFTLPLPA